MKTILVGIKGASPLLMHRYPLVPIEGLQHKSEQEQAEVSAYRDPITQRLFIPGVNIQRAMVSAAAFSKGKGRASLQKVIAACLFISPEIVDLGVTTFALDSRAVVVPATKGRIVRHRPRLDQWAVKFTIDFDDARLKEEQVRKIVDDAGSSVGLLDFRPERKGPFGRFMVTSWNE